MKKIGIYPGAFQPATRAHSKVYKELKQLVGEDVFVITTDKNPTPEAPLNFGEKEAILVRHNIPISHIVKVHVWKHPVELFHKFSNTHTVAIFAINHKEYLEIVHRKVIPPSQNGEIQSEVWMDISGKPSYFQPYKGHESEMKPFGEHGYVIVIDDGEIDDKPVTTANIREVLGSKKYTSEQRKKFFVWVFGWFDIALFQMVSEKFKGAFSTADTATPQQKNITPDDTNSTQLKEIVNGIFNELSPSPSSTPAASDSPLDAKGQLPNDNAIRQKSIANRTAAVKQKQQAERELKSLQADAKWKEADILNKNKNELPNKRKEIDSLNKQISSPTV